MDLTHCGRVPYRTDIRGPAGLPGARTSLVVVVPDRDDSPIRDGESVVATHRFLCPSCGKRLKIDDAMLADARRRDRGAHCPTCGAPFRLDGLAESPPARGSIAAGGTENRDRDADG